VYYKQRNPQNRPFPRGLIYYELIPEECTVNKEMYMKILHCCRDAVGRKNLKNEHKVSDYLCTTSTYMPVIGSLKVPCQAHCDCFGASTISLDFSLTDFFLFL
jgi:hypothetical protein